MASATCDVVVVGAGITGSFASYCLVRRGIETTLIDRSGVGTQASGHNPGGLNPLHGVGIPGPLASLTMASFKLHVDEWEAIGRLSGADFHWRRADRLLLAFDEEDQLGLTRTHDLHQTAEGFSASWLDHHEALALEPRLNPAITGAVLTQGSACVDGHRYTAAVAAAAVALGATLVHGEVRGLKTDGSRVTGVILDSGELACDAVVLATGPWWADPARWLDTSISIRPLKGELLVAQIPGASIERDLTWRRAALYPRLDGTMWLGGTEEDAGFDAAPTPEGRASILAGTTHILPAARNVRVIRQLAGLRPVSPDGFPIIGPAPAWENVYLANGGGRKGMLLSAGMGEAVAELISRGCTSLQIACCLPERFTA